MAKSHTATTASTSKSWSFCSSSLAEVPLYCFHLRMLHSKCGHISYLECHEEPWSIPHVGWALEKTPSRASSSCFEMKLYLRIKDEHCKFCRSYLNPPLTTTVSTIGDWFSRTEKRVNLRALPQEIVNAVLDSWESPNWAPEAGEGEVGEREEGEGEEAGMCYFYGGGDLGSL